MAGKSGVSHGFAALLGLLAGELVVTYVRPVFPPFVTALEKGAQWVAAFLNAVTGTKVAAEVFVPAVVVFLLAFLWGVIYHLARHGREAG